MFRMLRSEWLKIRRSIVWLLAAVSPLLAALAGFLSFRNEGEFPWLEAMSLLSVLHAMLFLPLLTGVFAALVCRYEHMGGGWKQVLALPVTRTQVYVVKFTIVMLLLGAVQLLFLAVLLLLGAVLGFSQPIPWAALLSAIAGGWLACLPLAALQMFVSVAFQSFAAPLAVNVIFTLPNMLIVNSSTYGPFYPWAQPMLAMLPREGYGFGTFNLSLETLLLVVLGSFCLFFASGLTYFVRKAV